MLQARAELALPLGSQVSGGQPGRVASGLRHCGSTGSSHSGSSRTQNCGVCVAGAEKGGRGRAQSGVRGEGTGVGAQAERRARRPQDKQEGPTQAAVFFKWQAGKGPTCKPVGL